MDARKGVLCAGTWCVDLNKVIAAWPAEDTSNEVLSIDRQGGGSGHNMAMDLKRLDPNLPVDAMGLVGHDDDGRFLLGQCDAFGVERSHLQARAEAPTLCVDAFCVAGSGRRTHFYYQGVAALLAPSDFDFARSQARILHLGLPGAHRRMDEPIEGQGNGWAAVLKRARAQGLQTSIELMSIAPQRLFDLARPILPHLDYLIVNDFEIGAVTGIETRTGDVANVNAVRRAITAAFALGPMRVIAVHFPQGAITGVRSGALQHSGSLDVPAEAIASVNGAGDAFAAGFLYGVHEGWEIEACARLAHSCAAASMRQLSTVAGVASVGECLALAERWGVRPAPG